MEQLIRNGLEAMDLLSQTPAPLRRSWQSMDGCCWKKIR